MDDTLVHIKHALVGTLFTSILWSEDILKTIVLAAIGATVSFFISIGWKYLKDKFFKK